MDVDQDIKNDWKNHVRPQRFLNIDWKEVKGMRLPKLRKLILPLKKIPILWPITISLHSSSYYYKPEASNKSTFKIISNQARERKREIQNL